MSKTQDKDTTIVYVTNKANSDKRWHTTDEQSECYNAPENAQARELWTVEPWYEPCAICTDREPPTTHNCNQAQYECAGCGQCERLGVTAVRTLHACQECNDVTSWERLEDVR